MTHAEAGTGPTARTATSGAGTTRTTRTAGRAGRAERGRPARGPRPGTSAADARRTDILRADARRTDILRGGVDAPGRSGCPAGGRGAGPGHGGRTAPAPRPPRRLAPVLPLSRALGRRPRTPATHLVWGWSGVLFDDTEAARDALNAAMLPYGLPPLSIREFRAAWSPRSADCYARLLGRRPGAAETAWLDRVVRGEYRRVAAGCGAAPDARRVLESWSALPGHTQSLLSLRPEHWVATQLRRLGLAERFDRAEGSGALQAEAKAGMLGGHLAALGLDPDAVVLIGDTTDDAEAARLAGCRAVLVAGGWQSRRTLRATGHPVVVGLADAVARALARAELV